MSTLEVHVICNKIGGGNPVGTLFCCYYAAVDEYICTVGTLGEHYNAALSFRTLD
jgi:hypothetical protein